MGLSQILPRLFLLLLLAPLYWGIFGGCAGDKGGGMSLPLAPNGAPGPNLNLPTPGGPAGMGPGTGDSGPGGAATPPAQPSEGTPRDPPLYGFVYKCGMPGNVIAKGYLFGSCQSSFQEGEKAVVQTLRRKWVFVNPDSGGGSGDSPNWEAGEKSVMDLDQGLVPPEEVFKWHKLLGGLIHIILTGDLNYRVTYFDPNWNCFRGDCDGIAQYTVGHLAAYKTTCNLHPEEFSKCEAPKVTGSVCYTSGAPCRTDFDSAPKVSRWKRGPLIPPSFLKDKATDFSASKTTGVFKDEDIELLNRTASLSYTASYCSIANACYTGLCKKSNQSHAVPLPLTLDKEGVELSCQLIKDSSITSCSSCKPPNPASLFEDLPGVPPKGQDPFDPTPGEGNGTGGGLP